MTLFDIFDTILAINLAKATGEDTKVSEENLFKLKESCAGAIHELEDMAKEIDAYVIDDCNDFQQEEGVYSEEYEVRIKEKKEIIGFLLEFIFFEMNLLKGIRRKIEAILKNNLANENIFKSFYFFKGIVLEADLVCFITKGDLTDANNNSLIFHVSNKLKNVFLQCLISHKILLEVLIKYKELIPSEKIKTKMETIKNEFANILLCYDKQQLKRTEEEVAKKQLNYLKFKSQQTYKELKILFDNNSKFPQMNSLLPEDKVPIVEIVKVNKIDKLIVNAGHYLDEIEKRKKAILKSIGSTTNKNLRRTYENEYREWGEYENKIEGGLSRLENAKNALDDFKTDTNRQEFEEAKNMLSRAVDAYKLFCAQPEMPTSGQSMEGVIND